ncbi:hypothetical protein A3D05_00155 [Candidatus Gottesmanbacteria bacterium RIFCSPHIGHO2_02_FULL_40_24]|uniref:Nucleoside triphosphate pyrophosphatase n=1 Tax=Candidatus Gottesmanbacteria bacterium RIFCSPHIGHO2_01_FULL_40_15 TaxID=1798376 RepID=A0A1F5Z681_9BACT|nr:MAG: hypothetical protein A2777_00160 [Candidatus Gottesmanbacteria bacterium RIFCSPHIGHO2_01_FULL_40_15]OGG17763.1 MAG: hypothetical protein A3D05_00155 [Candidatus Gottesmanbacteria bacterium RIFCSPHIGHO2_02_FULL_40_24]OGG21875.1 MAG: hypothetical protein A3B48_04085 [Candidatus Gottesmanbacteria bacterium RIFCSPLOWO2_01_FULL_40_10]OGG25507.1 MAG: hypothetical protein A3E42_03625 [Candidatus Gottesmanbacteria bacterium RIFCSPHIGHO2_12_FULL_40_13]OGG33165.1 MAG: hypothetical protein A3I80_0
MAKLILASSSLGREKLLSYLNVPFKIIPSQLDEDKIKGSTPLETIRLRARLKGEDVAGIILNSPQISPRNPDRYLIISADSGAIINENLIGKPDDKKEAVSILKMLSGRTHQFITAVYILKVDNSKSNYLKIIQDNYSTSQVTFRDLSDEDIKLYLSLTDYTRYAAGYRLIGSQTFITQILGSISNVIGLPLEVIIPVLKKEKLLRP